MRGEFNRGETASWSKAEHQWLDLMNGWLNRRRRARGLPEIYGVQPSRTYAKEPATPAPETNAMSGVLATLGIAP